jgi:hypothetical protein
VVRSSRRLTGREPPRDEPVAARQGPTPATPSATSTRPRIRVAAAFGSALAPGSGSTSPKRVTARCTSWLLSVQVGTPSDSSRSARLASIESRKADASNCCWSRSK